MIFSSKFTVDPLIDEVKSVLLVGLKRFADNVCRKYHAIQRAKNSKGIVVDNCDDLSPSTNHETLGTNLRPTNGWAPDNSFHASRGVEAFLLKIEKELGIERHEKAQFDNQFHQFILEQAEQTERFGHSPNRQDKLIHHDEERSILNTSHNASCQ